MHDYSGPKNPEAKDTSVSLSPPFDAGAALAGARERQAGGLAFVFALALCLVLSVGLVVHVVQARTVIVGVDLVNGRTMTRVPGQVVEDSILFKPVRLIALAQRFCDLRFAYEWQAGDAKLFAARQLAVPGFAQTIAMSPDLVQRYYAQQTRITLRYEQSTVQYLGNHVFAVTIRGTRFLNNVQWTEVTGAKPSPFKEVVYLQPMNDPGHPAYLDGVAVRGATGDLE